MIRKSRGMSLLELMVGLALMAVLIGGVVGFAFNMIERRDRAHAMMRREEGASAAFTILERALATTFAAPQHEGGIPGIVGDAGKIRVLSRNAVPGESSDMGGIEMRWEPGPAGGVLVCSEVSSSGELEKPDRIASDVSRFRLRYRTGRAWSDRMDSSATGLPGLIEVSLWFTQPGPTSGAAEAEESTRLPDRQRLITIPDGPGVWGEGSGGA